jgi:hypothetical protein
MALSDERVDVFIEDAAWQFDSTMADDPRFYVLERDYGGAAFDALCQRIERGEIEHYRGHRYRYLRLGDWHYWLMPSFGGEAGRVINRKLRAAGHEQLRLLPDQPLSSASTRLMLASCVSHTGLAGRDARAPRAWRAARAGRSRRRAGTSRRRGHEARPRRPPAIPGRRHRRGARGSTKTRMSRPLDRWLAYEALVRRRSRALRMTCAALASASVRRRMP